MFSKKITLKKLSLIELKSTMQFQKNEFHTKYFNFYFRNFFISFIMIRNVKFMWIWMSTKNLTSTLSFIMLKKFYQIRRIFSQIVYSIDNVFVQIIEFDRNSLLIDWNENRWHNMNIAKNSSFHWIIHFVYDDLYWSWRYAKYNQANYFFVFVNK